MSKTTDIIKRLDEIVTGAEHGVPVLVVADLLTINDAQIEIEDLRSRLVKTEKLLREVRYDSGVELDDERLSYLPVQIDRSVWEEIAEAVPRGDAND